MAKDVMGRFCEYVYANVETLTYLGALNWSPNTSSNEGIR